MDDCYTDAGVERIEYGAATQFENRSIESVFSSVQLSTTHLCQCLAWLPDFGRHGTNYSSRLFRLFETVVST